MTRDIKFRGKTKRGDWVYGNYTFLKESAIDAYCTIDEGHYISDLVGFPCAYKVIAGTVGQYTGLKDKNGKEIYEGDIIKHSYLRGEAVDVVKYYNECAAFGMDSGSGLIELGSASFHYGLEELSYDKSTFEVIGNIHENPDLIP